jgi:hypothetical protein
MRMYLSKTNLIDLMILDDHKGSFRIFDLGCVRLALDPSKMFRVLSPSKIFRGIAVLLEAELEGCSVPDL